MPATIPRAKPVKSLDAITKILKNELYLTIHVKNTMPFYFFTNCLLTYQAFKQPRGIAIDIDIYAKKDCTDKRNIETENINR
jgi:hypothetical protein